MSNFIEEYQKNWNGVKQALQKHEEEKKNVENRQIQLTQELDDTQSLYTQRETEIANLQMKLADLGDVVEPELEIEYVEEHTVLTEDERAQVVDYLAHLTTKWPNLYDYKSASYEEMYQLSHKLNRDLQNPDNYILEPERMFGTWEAQNDKILPMGNQAWVTLVNAEDEGHEPVALYHDNVFQQTQLWIVSDLVPFFKRVTEQPTPVVYLLLFILFFVIGGLLAIFSQIGFVFAYILEVLAIFLFCYVRNRNGIELDGRNFVEVLKSQSMLPVYDEVMAVPVSDDTVAFVTGAVKNADILMADSVEAAKQEALDKATAVQQKEITRQKNERDEVGRQLNLAESSKEKIGKRMIDLDNEISTLQVSPLTDEHGYNKNLQQLLADFNGAKQIQREVDPDFSIPGSLLLGFNEDESLNVVNHDFKPTVIVLSDDLSEDELMETTKEIVHDSFMNELKLTQKGMVNYTILDNEFFLGLWLNQTDLNEAVTAGILTVSNQTNQVALQNVDRVLVAEGTNGNAVRDETLQGLNKKLYEEYKNMGPDRLARSVGMPYNLTYFIGRTTLNELSDTDLKRILRTTSLGNLPIFILQQSDLNTEMGQMLKEYVRKTVN